MDRDSDPEIERKHRTLDIGQSQILESTIRGGGLDLFINDSERMVAHVDRTGSGFEGGRAQCRKDL